MEWKDAHYPVYGAKDPAWKEKEQNVQISVKMKDIEKRKMGVILMSNTKTIAKLILQA